MKRVSFIIISICTLFAACKNDGPDKHLHRVVFDPGNLKFISTSLNRTKETSSALYGNKEALESLSGENIQPLVGSALKLVTWKYHENPQYIGGTITGELLSIETLEVDKNGTISYQYKDSTQTVNNASDKEERIKYIMSYKPVTRP